MSTGCLKGFGALSILSILSIIPHAMLGIQLIIAESGLLDQFSIVTRFLSISGFISIIVYS